MEEETVDLKTLLSVIPSQPHISYSKEWDRTQQAGLYIREYSEHSSNPYIHWSHLQPLPSSVITSRSQLWEPGEGFAQSPDLTKTHKRREWIDESCILFQALEGSLPWWVRDLMPIAPNVTSSNVTALNTHPSPFLNLPVPVSISHASWDDTHPSISYLIKQFANFPLADSLLS